MLLAAAAVLAAIAFISPFLPPFPVPGWILGGALTRPFEHWWYLLPDGRRSVLLYSLGTTIGSMVYPALVALVFWVWTRDLRREGTLYPRRTVILAGTVVAVSAFYFVSSWSYGIKYQGPELLALYVAFNAVMLLSFASAWFRYRRSRAWWPSLILHWSLFTWMCIAAFPWLGELI